MIVLVVGPSGVGKTTCCKAAKSRFPSVIFRSLDGLVAAWGVENGLIAAPRIAMLSRRFANPELFLDIGLLAIGQLAGKYPGRHLVVDVGAGFQVATTAQHLHRLFRLIAITADPEVAYKRIKAERDDERTREQYLQYEYQPSRVAVYNSAQHAVDTSAQSVEQACEQFAGLLDEILELQNSRRSTPAG